MWRRPGVDFDPIDGRHFVALQLRRLAADMKEAVERIAPGCTSVDMTVREPLIAVLCRRQGRGDRSALVPWWSIAKTAIAGMCAGLVADGRRSRRTMPAAVHLRQLLQHTSGLPCYTRATSMRSRSSGTTILE